MNTMVLFYALAALLALAVLGALLWPLLRPRAGSDVSQQRLNAAVYKEQLAALEHGLANQSVSRADYEAARDELHLRLLDDEKEAMEPLRAQATRFWTTPRSAWALALVLPLASGGMYAWLGAPAALDAAGAVQAQQREITRMVDGLAARLKANPENPKGWAMLARSYKVLGRLEEAEQAYARIGPMMETDADLLVNYADVVAARTDSFDGKPKELLRKALALDPRHPVALMLVGTAAYREGDYGSAVAQWEKLLPMLEPASAEAEQLEADLAQARSKAGMQPRAITANKLPPAQAPMAAAQGAQAAPAAPPRPEDMVARLAERLQSQPDDLAGWARLARAYKVLGRLDQAEAAYAKAARLVDSDPNMLADLADLLATRAGGKLEGKPMALIQRALALDPEHPMALMLAGTAAFQRGEYDAAARQWEKLRPLLAPGSRDAEWLGASIAEARGKAGAAIR